MKMLSIEEASELHPMRKGKYNWLYKKLMLLKTGEGIVILFTDWKTKTTPYLTLPYAGQPKT